MPGWPLCSQTINKSIYYFFLLCACLFIINKAVGDALTIPRGSEIGAGGRLWGSPTPESSADAPSAPGQYLSWGFSPPDRPHCTAVAAAALYRSRELLKDAAWLLLSASHWAKEAASSLVPIRKIVHTSLPASILDHLTRAKVSFLLRNPLILHILKKKILFVSPPVLPTCSYSEGQERAGACPYRLLHFHLQHRYAEKFYCLLLLMKGKKSFSSITKDNEHTLFWT